MRKAVCVVNFILVRQQVSEVDINFVRNQVSHGVNSMTMKTNNYIENLDC